MVSRWRNEYEQRGEEAFLPPTTSEASVAEARIAELERFCGQLALKNALLKKALGKLPFNSDTRYLNTRVRRNCPYRSVISVSCCRSIAPGIMPGTIEPVKQAEEVTLHDAIEQVILEFF